MPYKEADQSGRKRAKKQYRVKNWKEYNNSLKKRGDIMFLVSEDVTSSWHAPLGTRGRGKQRKYSDMAIISVLTIRAILNIPLRAVEGFVNGLFDYTGIKLKSPDYTTLSRRMAKLKDFRIPTINRFDADNHTVTLDSTGIKMTGEKEWMNHKHGTRPVKSWRKLHLAIDENGFILASKMTSLHEGDSTVAPKLLDEIKGNPSKIIADGGYSHRAMNEYFKGKGQAPEIIIPPNKNALPSPDKCDQELAHILYIKEKGRHRWQNKTGYNKRSLVENTNSRYKTIFGNKLKSKTFNNQSNETLLNVQILNWMFALGMPKSVRI